VDPCVKCGATILVGTDACTICGTVIRRLTSKERARRRAGPRIAAAATLGILGAILVIAGIVFLVGFDTSGVRLRTFRFPLFLIVCGLGCFGAAGRTLRDE